MAFDYKKEYKEFYMPKAKPEIVTIPKMNFLAVRGSGDPNEEGGEYKASIGLLYGIAFTIKMSKKGARQIEGYFDYVVPPLEGFWQPDYRYPFEILFAAVIDACHPFLPPESLQRRNYIIRTGYYDFKPAVPGF